MYRKQTNIHRIYTEEKYAKHTMNGRNAQFLHLLLNNNIAIYSWNQLKQPVPQFCTEFPHAADTRLDLRL